MKKTTVLILIALLSASVVMASSVTKDVVGDGNWTDPLSVEKGASVNVSISDFNATTDMTITLQRKLPGDSDWGRYVESWDVTGSTAGVEAITEPEAEHAVQYRLGCDAAGDYSSGNCTCRLGGGRK